jgi:hypothetical protein
LGIVAGIGVLNINQAASVAAQAADTSTRTTTTTTSYVYTTAETTTAKPRLSLNSNGVTVEYSEGAFPAGVRLQVEALALTNPDFQMKNHTVRAAYRVSFTNASGAAIEPSEEVRLGLPHPTMVNNENLLRILSDGTQEQLQVTGGWGNSLNGDPDGTYVRTDHSGVFVVLEDNLSNWIHNGISEATKILRYWRESLYIYSAEMEAFLASVGAEDAEIVAAYRNGTLDALVQAQLDTYKVFLQETLDEQQMRMASAYVAMCLAKDEYTKFSNPFTFPEGTLSSEERNALPRRLLSTQAMNSYYPLRQSTESWYDGARQFAKTTEERIALYEQAKQKWEQALQQIKNLGYVDTTQIEIESAREKTEFLLGLADLPWQSGDIRKGYTVDSMKAQLENTMNVYLHFNDTYSIVTAARSGELVDRLTKARAAVIALAKEQLTGEAFKVFQEYLAVCDKSNVLMNLYQGAETEEKIRLLFQIMASQTNDMLPRNYPSYLHIEFDELDLTPAQKAAIEQVWASWRELFTYYKVDFESVQGRTTLGNCFLWLYQELGKTIGVDLVPIIDVIEKPVIPNAPTTDPPSNPDQSNAADTKEHFKLWGKETKWEKSPLTWFLLIVCFGWLWMVF